MKRRVLESLHEDLADVIEHVQDGGPVLLEHNGKPVAAVVSVSDLHLLDQYMEELEDRVDIEEAQKALAEIEKEGTVPYEEVRRELGSDDK